MGASVFRLNAQGVGPLVETFPVPVGATYRVIMVELRIAPAATTQAEYLTITHDSVYGAGYDVIMYRLDPATVPTLDMIWQPDGEFYMIGGDALDVNWANSGGRTWGLMVTMQEVP